MVFTPTTSNIVRRGCFARIPTIEILSTGGRSQYQQLVSLALEQPGVAASLEEQVPEDTEDANYKIPRQCTVKQRTSTVTVGQC